VGATEKRERELRNKQSWPVKLVCLGTSPVTQVIRGQVWGSLMYDKFEKIKKE
jgi:hypothetical protein